MSGVSINKVVVVVEGLVGLGSKTSTTLVVEIAGRESLERFVEVKSSVDDLVSIGVPDREVSISEASPKRRIPTTSSCSSVLPHELLTKKINVRRENTLKRL